MLKALIPVELTLASNIALRYVCQKAKLLGMEIQPIHVEEPDNKSHSAQTGWIRKSWETGLLQAGREEVRRILNSEKLDCFVMPEPVVAIGPREDRILEELWIGRYDLFVEGEVVNFNTSEFRKRLRSKLYKKMTCPALIVRNLIQSDKIVLLLDARTDQEHLVDVFSRFFTDTSVEMDVCVHSMDDLQRGNNPDAVLSNVVSLLTARGYKPGRAFSLLGAPESATQALRDYSMVFTRVDRTSTRKSPLIEILGSVPCPLFLCW